VRASGQPTPGQAARKTFVPAGRQPRGPFVFYLMDAWLVAQLEGRPKCSKTKPMAVFWWNAKQKPKSPVTSGGETRNPT
jgi:hypothetical protein